MLCQSVLSWRSTLAEMFTEHLFIGNAFFVAEAFTEVLTREHLPSRQHPQDSNVDSLPDDQIIHKGISFLLINFRSSPFFSILI